MGKTEGRQAEEHDLSSRSQENRSGAESPVGEGKGQQVTGLAPATPAGRQSTTALITRDAGIVLG